MQMPPIRVDEADRLASLRRLGILDTPREERFDRIVRLAQRMLGTEVAYVSLIDADRQWFKARVGFAAPETPRELSFCAHAIAAGPEPTVVEDLTLDARFEDNPIVKFEPGVRFYAGCPIAAPDGALLGTLCVLDRQPRGLAPEDLQTLQDLAAMVESEIAAIDLAVTDALTGLLNRAGYERLIGQIDEVRAHHGLPAAVVYFDLDNLKPINDFHGHDAGDAALIRVGKILRKSFRASDLIARLGGDEFCVVLTGTAVEEAGVAVDRFRDAVAEWNESTSEPWELALSVGFATTPDGSDDLSSLMRSADAMMYAEKRTKSEARSTN